MATFRILLVDDSAEFRALLERLLRALGFNIAGSVGSGEEAIAAVAAAQPEVAIVDIAMPGLNGLDTARRIRAKWPAIKILILTLHATPEYREAAAALGVDGFVTKTELVPELHLALRRLRQ